MVASERWLLSRDAYDTTVARVHALLDATLFGKCTQVHVPTCSTTTTAADDVMIVPLKPFVAML